MPIIRTTFFFKMDQYGWTESYFRDGTLVPIVANDPYMTLAWSRSYLNGGYIDADGGTKGTPGLMYIRNSVIDAFRDARIYVPPFPMRRKFNDHDPCDMPWTALNTRFETLDARDRRFILMSGLPDSFFVGGTTFTPDAFFLPRWATYKAALLAGNFGYPKASGTAFAVTGMVYDALTKMVLLTTTGTAPAKTPSINVKGIRSVPGMNGIYPLRAVPGGYGLGTFPNSPLLSGWQGEGTFSFAGYALMPFTDLMWVGPRRRTRGRPFDSPRGRIKRRVSCRA